MVLERTGPGGQAGRSMRIENYLGFPTGVTGPELAVRPLQRVWAGPIGKNYWYQCKLYNRAHRRYALALLALQNLSRPSQCQKQILGDCRALAQSCPQRSLWNGS